MTPRQLKALLASLLPYLILAAIGLTLMIVGLCDSSPGLAALMSAGMASGFECPECGYREQQVVVKYDFPDVRFYCLNCEATWDENLENKRIVRGP